MSEEVTAVATETKTTTDAPRERAPRIDFESMSIEELKAFVEKPIEKVPMPSKKAMEEAVAKIESEIATMRARFDEIKAEREMIFAGFRLQKVGIRGISQLQQAREESFSARKALFDSRNELTAKREAAFTEFNSLKTQLESIRASLKQASRVKPAELEEKIRNAEMKIETESLSMKEEKELRRQIMQWEADLRTAKVSDGLYEKRESLEESMKKVRATLDTIKKQLDEVYTKLGAERKEKKEEGEEKKEEKEDPVKKLNEEWEANKAAIDAKYAEKKALMNEYYQKERAFRQYTFENKRMNAARYVLERKNEELEEAERQKKEAEEALKRHPFEKEMALCDSVISYLKGLLPAEKKAAKLGSEIKVPEGMTLMKKEEQDYFSVPGGRKNKKERKASKKNNFLVHNLSSLESFSTIRIVAPNTVEEVEPCIEKVVARKAFFDKLPRGSDIDAELAKEN